MPGCPACGRPAVALGPVSKLTGRRIGRCRSCRAHFWANAAAVARQQPVSEELGAGSTADRYGEWVGIKREQAGPEVWAETAAWLRRSVRVHGERRPVLYDVGAGDGQFLALARDRFGFDVTGNDVVPGAVALAQERYGVDLELGDLGGFGHRTDVDAVTLWCVLAHVDDGDALLRQVHDMLRPGGLLALQTPHWTGVDAGAHVVQRVTRGRVTRLNDRRVGPQHHILHTAASITAQLHRLGFTEVEVLPRGRYTLTAEAYLISMSVPRLLIRPAAWLFDHVAHSRLAPKIVLDVRARRR